MKRLDEYPIGTVYATDGRWKLFPPWPCLNPVGFARENAKRLLYSFIEKVGKGRGYPIAKCWPDHVSTKIGPGTFFEMTDPVGQKGSLDVLRGRLVAACVPQFEFDEGKFIDTCLEYEGTPYDYIELPAFLLDHKLKTRLVNTGILDKYNRLTCSTTIGTAFQESGGPIPPVTDDEPSLVRAWQRVIPAFFINYPQLFTVEMHESAVP